MNIKEYKKNKICSLNKFPVYADLWIFIRGYFENNGYIIHSYKNPKCIINFYNQSFMKELLNYIKMPYSVNKYIEKENKQNKEYLSIEIESTNCIDFLGKIYKNKEELLYQKNMYETFECLINWKLLIKNSNLELDICKIYKDDSNAIIPTKGHESDVGYDLTIIKKYKQLTPSTILYDTGIILNVDYGYYIEIVPRSSLSKSGYILTNSIGIIEKSYSGTLLVSLTKIDKEMPDLILPFKCCQLIFKPQISLKILEMKNLETLNETVRSKGGFGSTSSNSK